MASEITQIKQCATVAQLVAYVSRYGMYGHSPDAEDHYLVKQAISAGYIDLQIQGFGDDVTFDLTDEGRRLINLPPDASLIAKLKRWLANLSPLKPHPPG